MLTRRQFMSLSAAIPTVALLSSPVFAATPAVFARGGVAINGYDPVAYFRADAPVKGKAAHTVSWQGATWQFADADNRAAFESAPEDFAPQYGGYCAYALSKNAIAKTEPDAWTINNGKLYLNYDTSVRALWQRDIPGNVARADANWPSVLNS